MTTPTPQEKGQAMTSPDEMEREELIALKAAITVPVDEYARTLGWSSEEISYMNSNGSSSTVVTWFPPDCDNDYREEIIESEAATIASNLWHLLQHDEPPPLASIKLASRSEALLDFAIAQEARISALEAKLSVNAITVTSYQAPPGWFGYVLTRPDGATREVEINVKQASTDPMHLIHIIEAAKEDFATAHKRKAKP